jgi:hypothetical protein
MIGVIGSQLVVTASERCEKPKMVQPGDREWVTVIGSICAAGWAIPPFIIYMGKVHISTWYEDKSIPHDWVITVSNNGWTNNDLGIAWLEYFNASTKLHTVGGYRLLILDGHESYHSAKFEEIYLERKIITLCMPSHSSHLLQPLDVGYFSPLKRTYSTEIMALVHRSITHIAKTDFLPAFKIAYIKTFTAETIKGAFRGIGLIPHNLDVVISRLDIRFCTPDQLPEQPTVWES